jgi:hypothetical protein
MKLYNVEYRVKRIHVAGHYNQLLSNQKKKLQEQMSELSQIQKILAMKEAKVKSMETKAGLVEAEVQRASRMLKSMSELTKNYTVTVSLIKC